MANKANSILSIVRKYIKELERNGYRIKEAFLFGSCAKGTAHEWSDIDIAFISPDFIGDRFEDRQRIVPMRRKIDTRLEPMPFKPRDFRDDPIMAEEIRQTGKRITLNK